jgi:hypothetical protein
LLIQSWLISSDWFGLFAPARRSLRSAVLGGAAVYRCDGWLLFRIGFSRCGNCCEA